MKAEKNLKEPPLRIIKSASEFLEFYEEYKSVKNFSFDTETTSLSYYNLNLTAFSMYSPLFPYAISVLINFTGNYFVKMQDPENKRRKIDVERTFIMDDHINFSDIAEEVKDWFSGAQIVGANGKFDRKVAHKYGFNNYELQDDVNSMAYYIDVNEPKNLKYNFEKYTGIKMTTYEEAVGQNVKNINWTLVDWKIYGEYSAKDAYNTWVLRDILMPILQKAGKGKANVYGSYVNIGLPISTVTAEMELNGVALDIPFLKNMESVVDKKLYALEETIYAMSGHRFNLNSGDQLGLVLYTYLGYPILKKTEKGKSSTDEATLKALAFEGYELPPYLLEYRKLSKLQNTYIKALPRMVDGDGLLRANFNDQGTVTGRYSSSSPNLQNQPNNKEFPVRKAYIPRANNRVLLIGDYSQIELRMFAHFSKDPYLIQAYVEGKDIHQMTAGMISKVTGLHISRQMGKTINFAVGFLMSPKSLQEFLNLALVDAVVRGEITHDEFHEHRLSVNQAKAIVNAYFSLFKGFDQYISMVTRRTQALGFSYTLSGFMRPIPDINSQKFFYEAKRQAVNTSIQGSAADLIKMTMIKVFDKIKSGELFDCKMVLQVHDELVFDVPEEKAEEYKVIIKKIAESVFQGCRVPLIFEMAIADNWHEMKAGKPKLGKSKIIDYIIKKVIQYG